MRERLLQMRQELRIAPAGDGTETVTLDQSRVGRLSRMDALQTQQIALDAQRRNDRKLLAIEAALRRLEAGDYGRCFVCDEAITAARLEFDPTVTRCVNCQDVSR